MKHLSLLLFAVALSATSPSLAQHREHGAHVHGSATLSIAFDGNQGQVEYKGAAESIVGFEHEAKSKKDQATLQKATDSFRSQFGKWVSFDAAPNCQWTVTSVGLQPEGEESHHEKHHDGHEAQHSDFVAKATVKCAQSPLGSNLKLDFTNWPKLKDLDVTILIGDIQKSVEVKGRPLTVELKK